MTESTVPHEDNDTPDASADDVKTVHADTPGAPEGAAVKDQGVKLDSDENDDPKSGGRPQMTESTVPHEDNDTPDASADDVKTVHADTPGAPEGAAVKDQG